MIGIAFVIAILLRLWWILPGRGGLSKKKKKKGFRSQVVAMAVLGSGKWRRRVIYRFRRRRYTFNRIQTGGHTSELLNLIKHLDPKKYRPLHLVRANTDIMSHDRSRAELNRSWILRSHEIPRSREVGQSWFSTMFSTIRAIISCVVLVFRVQPKVLFCNGPGTCVPVCFACLLLRFLGLGRNCKIIFVESFCRSQSLSLSGRILYPIVNRFVVHWEELARSLRSRGYTRVEYLGTLF